VCLFWLLLLFLRPFLVAGCGDSGVLRKLYACRATCSWSRGLLDSLSLLRGVCETLTLSSEHANRCCWSVVALVSPVNFGFSSRFESTRDGAGNLMFLTPKTLCRGTGYHSIVYGEQYADTMPSERGRFSRHLSVFPISTGDFGNLGQTGRFYPGNQHRFPRKRFRI